MNSKINHTDTNKAFEQEAAEGFELFPDAEVYFNSIQNPFLKSVPKSPHLSWSVIGLELLVLTGMLFGFSYWSHKNVKHAEQLAIRQTKSHPVTAEVVFPQKTIIPEVATTIHVSIKPNVSVLSIAADSVNEYIMVSDTTMPLLSNALEKKDSIIQTSQKKFEYHYEDYSRKYPLRYLANMLVINYTDTIKPTISLKPILTGVPARYENDSVMPVQKQPETFPLKIRTNNYLTILSKPMQYLFDGNNAKAIKEFNKMLKENDEDQNALFYGMVAHYNLANYSQVLAFAHKTKCISKAYFEQDVDWYTAMAYHKMGLMQKSEEILEKIVHSNSFYRDRAKAFLTE